MKTTLLPNQTLERLRAHVAKVPHMGNVICAGVYGGGDIVAMASRRPDITFHAIDSWEGLSEPTMIDNPFASRGRFAYPLAQFMENVKGYNVEVYQMWINDVSIQRVTTVPQVDMIWVDLDHAQPTKAVLDYFMPKCTESASVLAHDYGARMYPGIRHVCNQHGEWQQLGHTLARLKR